MKILVIGGTYFLGKEFARLAAEDNELFFINRGNRLSELSKDEREHTFVMDRHDREALGKVSIGEIDAVVDFCAYQEGDISMICSCLGSSIRQYIYVSTTDVYMRGTGKEILTEEAEFETRDYGGEAGSYILGKAALEREVRRIAENDSGFNGSFTVIRPAFIYGPDNYAPREGIYFNWITKAGRILSPEDSDGYFQMVYVTDAARAILMCCGNEKAYGRAFNVCGEKKITYKSFEEAVIKVSGEVFGVEAERIPVDIASIEERGIPLPFPLRKEESEYYDNGRIRSLGSSFRDIEEGLRETAVWYRKLNSQDN